MNNFQNMLKNSLIPPPICKMAHETPATRDRYVDFLRAFSISVVVIGHWLSALIIRDSNGIKVYNAVGIIPGMWAITWVLQVMPIFFFIGGFSNFVTYNAFMRKGESKLAFLRTRAIRLFKPTSVFLGVWVLIQVILSLIFKNWSKVFHSIFILLTPLWFLAVYLGLVFVTPVVRKLHILYRAQTLIILVGLIMLVDFVRFYFKFNFASWANVGFVWLFVHQLGFFYADGSLLRIPKWAYWVMALGGLGALIFLTNIGVYPKSMVGTGLEKISNMNPPTICIAALTLWLVGAAMLLRGPISRWLARQKPWIMVIAANSMIMTLYLWHLTAYAIAFIILSQLGLGQQIESMVLWWLQRPVWIIIPGVVLIGLAAIFGRFERLTIMETKIKSLISQSKKI